MPHGAQGLAHSRHLASSNEPVVGGRGTLPGWLPATPGPSVSLLLTSLHLKHSRTEPAHRTPGSGGGSQITPCAQGPASSLCCLRSCPSLQLAGPGHQPLRPLCHPPLPLRPPVWLPLPSPCMGVRPGPSLWEAIPEVLKSPRPLACLLHGPSSGYPVSTQNAEKQSSNPLGFTAWTRDQS